MIGTEELKRAAADRIDEEDHIPRTKTVRLCNHTAIHTDAA